MNAAANRIPSPALALTSTSGYVPKHGTSAAGAGKSAPEGGPVPESEPEPEGPDGRRPKKHRALKIALAVVLVLLAAGYGAGWYVFSSRYYPGTTVLGNDISLLDADEAETVIEEAVASYTLTVEGGSFSWSYTPASSAELVDARDIAEEILAQNDPLAWPVHLGQALGGGYAFEDLFSGATSADLASGFDLEAFTAGLEEAVEAYNAERTGSFDPEHAYDEEAGAFTVEQARDNELLDADAILESALTAVAQLSTTVELDDSHRVALADGATDEELQTVCDAANALISANLTFTLGTSEVATLDGDQLFAWISFDEELVVSLDTDALTEWATELAESCNTVGTERTWTREDGTVCTVSDGTWGWEVDVDAFVETVQEAVAEGSEATVEIPTTSEADTFTAQGERDWGAYIDVDISEQWARYYDEDGNLVWESGVITGNTTSGDGTPTGVYYINAMYRNVTLRGRYNSETGEYAWETPVSYWMAFVGSSVGLHDATWQSSSNFGVPGANTWTGSHGCVNLPLSAAEELYDLAYTGLCVVVHD